MSNFGVLPIGPIGYPGDLTVARYKRELALHISEEIRLRGALARAESLLRQRGMAQPEEPTRRLVWRKEAADCVANLTPRQHEIMDLVLAGHPSKNIAADLGISQRTVENHRAAIMRKTGSNSLPALGRFGFAALQTIVPERARDGFCSG
jgi:DNA-binding NarL/FixJ family response regulator